MFALLYLHIVILKFHRSENSYNTSNVKISYISYSDVEFNQRFPKTTALKAFALADQSTGLAQG